MAALALVVGLMALGGNQAQATHVSCGDTLTADTTLDSDLTCATAPGLTIGTNGITLDCDGFTVTGPGSGDGILLDGRSGVTVKSCHVTNFTLGFHLSSSHGNTLEGNTAKGSGLRGFRLFSSHGNTLIRNRSSGGFDGFKLISSSNNILTKNAAMDNQLVGFRLESSDGNTLTTNKAWRNGEGFFLILTSGNTLAGNRALRNGQGFHLTLSDGTTLLRNTALGSGANGFVASATSVSNTFTRNQSFKNGKFGYIDFSTGSGTAGTDNDYDGNLCTFNTAGGSGPTSLCLPQP